MLLSESNILLLRKKYKLSSREIEYVKLLFEGINDNEALSQALDNTLLTAKIHVTNIYKKLRVNHKLAAVLKIIEDCKLLNFPIKDPSQSLIEIFQTKYNLTNRESDLLKILCNSVTANKDIAKHMDISFRTSIYYLKNSYKKTFTNNKLSLVTKFIDECRVHPARVLIDEEGTPSTLEKTGDFSDKITNSNSRSENSGTDSYPDQ